MKTTKFNMTFTQREIDIINDELQTYHDIINDELQTYHDDDTMTFERATFDDVLYAIDCAYENIEYRDDEIACALMIDDAHERERDVMRIINNERDIASLHRKLCRV